MKQIWLAAAISLGVVSCAEEAAQSPQETADPSQEAAHVGNLSLKLTGTDSQGRQYRLRNADFLVTNSYYYYGPGYPYDYEPKAYPYGTDGGMGFTTTVSTETNPNADTINLTLVPGDYMVALQGSWYIERMTATGPERIERAVLLSEGPQYAYIYQNSVYPVVFRFGVDGELIDFRHGDLVISSEFELPGDSQYDGGPQFPRDAQVMRPPSADAGTAVPVF